MVITLYITGVGDPGLTRCLQSSLSNLTKPFLAAWLQSQTVVSNALTVPSVKAARKIIILERTKRKIYIYTPKVLVFFFFFFFFVKILAVEFLTMVAIRLGGLAWDQGAPLALSFFFGEELRETRRMVP